MELNMIEKVKVIYNSTVYIRRFAEPFREN